MPPPLRCFEKQESFTTSRAASEALTYTSHIATTATTPNDVEASSSKIFEPFTQRLHHV